MPTEYDGLVALEPLVGEWDMEAGPPGGPPWPGAARIKFEWIENRAFLRQSWTIEMPEAPDGVAIIGVDREKGEFFQLYSDERNVHRIYEMSFADGEWRLQREAQEPFPQRMFATVSDDGNTISGRWEKCEGDDWDTDFEFTYTRIS